MKILKLFALFILVVPLYLSAEEPIKNQEDKNMAIDNSTINNTAVESQPDTTQQDAIIPAENTPVDSANPNTVPIITLPVKSFPNSVEGSQAFVKNMLDLVYLELPKRNGNQEVFNYLSVVTTEYFAFTYMSKWTIGRDVIKDLPSDLQEKYLASSKEFMILLYGEIFNTYYKQYNYSLGESVRRTDTEYSIKMKVESKVQDARNQDAILNVIWKVKYSEKEKKFFVTDVDVNGIVFLTTQKKQFGDMLNSTNNDFAKFLELLDAKNTESKKRLGISM
jgi:ABC-type transporter MlaC component